MIDPKKVRLMTRLAIYEEGKGKKDLKINRCSRGTYLSMKQFEGVIAITIAYMLAAILYCFGIYTDIITRGLSFPYKRYVLCAAVLYFIVLVLYVIFTRRYYKKRYDEMQTNIKQYEKDLQKLGNYLEKEESHGI